MTAATTTPTGAVPALTDRPTRSAARASRAAFKALLLRDMTVLRKNLKEFIPRTVLQPFLLVFVFTFVFPKIGQGIGASGGGGAAGGSFATLLVAGVVGITILFQGIQSVALPMVQEFGYTKEIEDRVLAPMPVSMVAFAKVVSGALQGLLAALIVFPIAAVVPANPVHLHVTWPVLLTLTPLACISGAALGLTFGTRFEPRTVPIMFGVVVIPLTFLGCVYYSWVALTPIKVAGISWLKILVLVNPLVYMSEGFRAALTNANHMSLIAVYGVLTGFAVLFLYLGINGFKKRVLS
ncbi:MAG TPA: ABC transporter permease [Acidimicrobiia bacterium]|nr:ABC transporter permease [Acidimicrobiia bacterium]